MVVSVSAPFRLQVNAPGEVSNRRVLLVDTNEGPNWVESNTNLKINWASRGGDYLDRAGMPQGGAAFATASISSFGVAARTFDVGALVEKLLAGDNTGIYIKQTAGVGWSKWAARGNPVHPAPTLSVITSSGTFNPPLVCDTFLADGANNSVGAFDYMSPPMLLKFDLSGITGAVRSAALTMTTFAQGVDPNQTFGAFYLETPRIITRPATQLGRTVAHGIAAQVAGNDYGLEGHRSVVVYDRMSSREDIWQGNWWIGARPALPGIASSNDWTYDPQYVAWPEYGMTAGRVTIPGAAQTGGADPAGVRMWHFVYPPDVHNKVSNLGPANPKGPRPWSAPWGSGPEEMYCRYMLLVERDVWSGMLPNGGVKLPGLAGAYDAFSDANTLTLDHSWFSARMEHGSPSPAHPQIFRPFVYLYDYEWNTGGGAGGGSGVPLWLDNNICFEAGQKYCIEQHVKLNTQVNGVWQSDGIIRVWIDGVLALNLTGRKIRANVNTRINEIPFCNFFHGGTQPPKDPIHYQIASVCVATEYIGPPKVIA